MTCPEKRRRVLKSVELYGGWHPMCFNCAGQILHLVPLPETLAALREAVSRERRALDRRLGKPDKRVFQYERRVGDRREISPLVREYPRVDDDMIIEVTIEDSSGDSEFDDLTQIRELVHDLRPAELSG